MKTKLQVALVLSVVGLLANLLILFSAASDTAASQQFEVIASGLDNPRGLAFGPEGALYVAEAGRGGNGPCTPFELFGGILCYGPTGAVTRIWRGSQTRIVTSLSSFAHQDGGFAFGPHDISFHGWGGAYVTVGACFAPNDSCGRLIHLQASGQWQVVADLGAYEVLNNPDGLHEGESNPYAVLALSGERIVTDAAGNDLLRVASNGSISTLAVFPQRLVDAPPSLGLPPGIQLSMDSVPTAVAVGPDGAFYVGELTGFPFPVGGARIYRVVPGEAPQVYADGFTNVIDIAFEDDGNLLVLEIAKNSLLSGDPTGALIRLKPNGSRKTLVSEGLTMPTAVVIGDDDALYISNCGACAGDGQVIRLRSPRHHRDH